MGVFTQYASNQYASGETSVLFLNRLAKSADEKRALIFATGVVSYSQQALSAAIRPLLAPLAEMGMAVYSIDAGGTGTWGNDTAIARFSDALTWLRANQGVTGPVIASGYSMGGVDAQNWAASNLSDFAGFIGFAPVCDLDWMYANGFSANLMTAYGESMSEMNEHDPLDVLYDELSTKPWHAFYSTTDAVVSPTQVQAMATATGGSLTTATGDHGTFLLDIDPDDVWAVAASML